MRHRLAVLASLIAAGAALSAGPVAAEPTLLDPTVSQQEPARPPRSEGVATSKPLSLTQEYETLAPSWNPD